MLFPSCEQRRRRNDLPLNAPDHTSDSLKAMAHGRDQAVSKPETLETADFLFIKFVDKGYNRCASKSTIPSGVTG